MILSDFHLHTCFCDGKDTPEQMVQTAIEKGFSALGFSMHSPGVDYGDWIIPPEDAAAYRQEIARLKAQYGDRLTILCGIEQDADCTQPTDPYDYVIMSVHGVQDPTGKRWEMDWSLDHLKQAIAAFGNDPYQMVEAYYERVGQLQGGDIVGHIDLVTKYLETEPLFDPNHPRYRAASQQAVDRLIKTGMLFEINVGAMSRGYCTKPYPALPLLAYICRQGGQIVLNGDCHDRAYLGAFRQQAMDLAKAAGFTRAVTLTPTGREFYNL